jgi:hypothetical protein
MATERQVQDGNVDVREMRWALLRGEGELAKQL